ncbi:GNAT family N-acetyltransferase [Shinella sp. M31]|uniref:GNAT family N-acetyltransferase n=1 Tax=Shinella sp. M31 TaxID=3368615 RepID=UPI003BA10713
MTMVVRRAALSDKIRVLMMAKAFHGVSGAPFPFSAPHADAIFCASVEQANRLCLVLDVNGVAEGVLVAEAGQHLFGDFSFASELVWWIEPPYRGRMAARMVNEYEVWAKAQGCTFAQLAGLGGNPAVGRLYERCGYTAAERHYLKSL